YNYGVLLLGINDFESAEAQFKKAIEIDPAYDNAIYNLGVTYLKWGTYLNKKADDEGKFDDEYKTKYQSALPYLEKAVKMKDADSQTWELLGKVYSVLGMNEDAANAFKKADEMRK
ncbi:MAG: tetratricopeptide repeat protein, partial [Ignavibacteria bacterium]|nr:tetratricopeptide repeat protein [Ignavibacteria bacterium]